MFKLFCHGFKTFFFVVKWLSSLFVHDFKRLFISNQQPLPTANTLETSTPFHDNIFSMLVVLAFTCNNKKYLRFQKYARVFTVIFFRFQVVRAFTCNIGNTVCVKCRLRTCVSGTMQIMKWVTAIVPLFSKPKNNSPQAEICTRNQYASSASVLNILPASTVSPQTELTGVYRVFSHGITPATFILVFQNNEPAAMLVFQTYPQGHPTRI